jgi:DnaJ-class molecular chaperone
MVSPFAALGLDDTASPEEVKVRFRNLARVHHPDAGGDAATFASLSESYLAALKKASDKACFECKGEGTRLITRGFSSIRVRCPACMGSRRAFSPPTQK